MSTGVHARIVCVGSRLVPGDDVGPRVFDTLKRRHLPRGLEVVDGGLAGLDLLRVVEGMRRVVFVDSVAAPGPEGGPMLLSGQQAIASRSPDHGHGGGIPTLVAMLPAVCEGRPPEVHLVGAASPTEDADIDHLADLSVRLATEGAAGRPDGSQDATCC